MDPGLWEVYESGSPSEEVSVILRLAKGTPRPAAVRVVSSFGDEIFTGRTTRGDIPALRQAPGVLSLKASTAVTLPSISEDTDEDLGETCGGNPGETAAPELPALEADGRGVVVGICDWGFDFTHPNFRNPDGTTRLLALWDQRGSGDPLAPAPYNYGRLLTRDAINAALAEPDPCAALGYHPARGDPSNSGSHGTHVTDIIAGSRREPGSRVGLASGSDLVCVDLAAPNLGELGNLGDSAGLLEGLDFIRQQAVGRPCVLHLSAGKTGGPHRGDTLLEKAVDLMLEEPGIALVQSVGNYADTAMHAHARIGPDQQYVLDWRTPSDDRTPNELEVWYSGQDVFEVTLIAPDGQEFSADLNTRVQLRDGLDVWGNLYHRRREPNSGLNHIDIYLYTPAPSGRWRVVLRGRDVVDGRLHAWIERDATGRFQSRFPRSQASSRYTTNTICNCFRAIAVGAYDSSRPDRPPTRFSSRGPTADGRQKPEIAAPGYRVLAARSMPRNGWRGEPRLVTKSGTSMAAPWVSGTVALMFQAAGRPLTIHEVRRALIGSADPHPGPAGLTSTQLGYGYLNTAAAVAAAQRMGRERPAPAAAPAAAAAAGEAAILEADAAWAPIWVTEVAETADYEGLAPAEDAEAAYGTENAMVAPAAGECACGCCGQRSQREVALEATDEDADSETDGMSRFAAPDEALAAPVVWEDVQEALEELGEIDLT